MRKLCNIPWYLKHFNIKVSNFINFVCYFNFVPCLQFTAEASLLQELNVKWKQQVNQRDAELYTKYGGALDLEVWNFLFFFPFTLMLIYIVHVDACVEIITALFFACCPYLKHIDHCLLRRFFLLLFFITCDHFFHFLVTFLFWISIELEVNFNIRTVSQL